MFVPDAVFLEELLWGQTLRKVSSRAGKRLTIRRRRSTIAVWLLGGFPLKP